MSELKVDKISALGTGVNVSSPVGIKTAAPTAAGDALYVNGNTDVMGAVEVVTVQAENYGVRIKAPLNNSNSILQFTNNNGTQRSYVASDSNNNLILGTGTQNRITINGASGLLSVLNNSEFLGDSNFRSPVSVNATSAFNSQATFNGTPPSCPTLPTLNSHLANKEYVDKAFKPTISNVAIATYFDRRGAGGYFNIIVPNGTKWLMIWCNDGSDGNSDHDNEIYWIGAYQSGVLEITGNGSTTYGAFLNSQSGGSGLGGRWAIFLRQS